MILGKLVTVLLSVVRMGSVSMYKWIVGGALIGGMFLGTYLYGYKSGKDRCDEMRMQAAQDVVEYYEQIIRENEEINDSVIADLRSIESETSGEIREIIKYVERNPGIGDCVLDPDGLSIFNGETRPD